MNNVVAIVYALIATVMFVVVYAEVLTLKHYHEKLELFINLCSDAAEYYNKKEK